MPSYGQIAGIPYVAVGNDELGGDVPSAVVCPNCKKKHAVKHSGILDYVKCTSDNEAYVVGLGGRSIAHT
jgi:hypothetical protein